MLKRIVSRTLFVLLFVTVFMGAFDSRSARTNASSPVETAQAVDTDWWPMLYHDLNHTGTSTSTGPTTNNTLWTYRTGSAVFSSPAVVGGLVYVGSFDNHTYCLNATTGALVWSYKTGGSVFSSPAVVDGLVYVGSDDNITYCLNATTGALVWAYKTGGSVFSSPAVVGDGVYVGSEDGKVYCLWATTTITGRVNHLVWSYKTGGWVVSSPAVVGGLVYVGSFDTRTYCLNATTGALVWSYKTGGSVVSSPAVVGGLVYVGSKDGKVYCLNAATGTQVWNYATDGGGSSPAVVGGLVYVGSYDGTYCLNATTGAPVWNYKTSGSGVSSLAVVRSLVYVKCEDDSIYCLNTANGSFVWSYKTGAYVDSMSSPAVVDGMVYVGSEDGKIYAFGPPLIVSISSTSITMSVGQSYLFTSTVSGGTPPYSYQWYINNASVSGATSATWTFTPTSAGSYTVFVNVADTRGANATVTSATATATVNAALSVSISPTSITLDVGQSQLFTSTVSAGTTSYSYQWYLDGVAVGTNSSSYSYTAGAGSHHVYVNVTDSASAPVTVESNTATVTVNSALLAPTVAPSPGTVDQGQISVLSSSAMATGTSAYSYAWYQKTPGGSYALIGGATSSNYNFVTSVSTATGNWSFVLQVTDHVGVSVNSTAATVLVNSAPTVSVSPAGPLTMNVGQSQTYTASVSSGTSPYTYQWYLNGLAFSGATNPTWAFAPTSAGSYAVYVNVTDAVGVQATFNTATVTASSQPLSTNWYIILAVVAAVIVVGLVVYKLLRRPKKPLVPAQLRIIAEPLSIIADGDSKSTITLQLLDKKGKPIPAIADTQVKISAARGKLENPVVTIPKGKDTEKTVIVSSTQSGQVPVVANAEGLKSISITLNFQERLRYCMHCGAVMPRTSRTCPNCGKVPPAGVDTKMCQNCNSVIPSIAKFCSECGAGQKT